MNIEEFLDTCTLDRLIANITSFMQNAALYQDCIVANTQVGFTRLSTTPLPTDMTDAKIFYNYYHYLGAKRTAEGRFSCLSLNTFLDKFNNQQASSVELPHSFELTYRLYELYVHSNSIAAQKLRLTKLTDFDLDLVDSHLTILKEKYLAIYKVLGQFIKWQAQSNSVQEDFHTRLLELQKEQQYLKQLTSAELASHLRSHNTVNRYAFHAVPRVRNTNDTAVTTELEKSHPI